VKRIVQRFRLTLTTALLCCAVCGNTQAQSGTRSFQMSLWPSSQDSRVPEIPADADLLMFEEGQAQPQGHLTILLFTQWTAPARLASDNYDWSRMLAVAVDEPYSTDLQHAGQSTQGNPCTDGRRTTILTTRQNIAATAAQLKAIAPGTRFWVNLAANNEFNWLKSSQCPALNQSYIDVVSLDYDPGLKPFKPDVQNDYAWLSASLLAHQQLALVPGTFHGNGISDTTAGGYLPDFFAYAENVNQTCNLGLGGAGRTGNFDGCKVWIVAGWLGPDYTDSGQQYHGELDADSSVLVRQNWRAESAKPIRPDLAHQLSRGQALQAILPALLNN
jgi:hypothetical protein